AGRRLAGARLADEAERLAFTDLERDVVDGSHVIHGSLDQEAFAHREPFAQVGDLEQCVVHACAPTGAPARSLAGCALRTRCPVRISRSSGSSTVHESLPA